MPRSLAKNALLSAAPVFDDPSQHRWLVVKSLMSIGMLLMIGLFTVLLVRVLNAPELVGPELQAQQSRVVVQQPDALDIADGATAGGPAGATSFFQ